MSEYKHTIAKTQQGGFATSPVQTVSNAGDSSLDNDLSIRDGIAMAVGFAYGKKVIGTVIKARITISGLSEVENVLEDVGRIVGYIAFGLIKPGVAGIAIGTDIITNGIDRAVFIYDTTLQNERLVQERGTRRDMGTGGYYG